MGADYLPPDAVQFEIAHPGLPLEHSFSTRQVEQRTVSEPPKVPVSISGPVATDQLICPNVDGRFTTSLYIALLTNLDLTGGTTTLVRVTEFGRF
jgi:hypothetical protein